MPIIHGHSGTGYILYHVVIVHRAQTGCVLVTLKCSNLSRRKDGKRKLKGVRKAKERTGRDMKDTTATTKLFTPSYQYSAFSSCLL